MIFAFTLFFLSAVMVSIPSIAQDARLASTGFVPPEVGRVTNLPLPRYVSLKAQKANARRGPGLTYRIDWVFQRRNMPLQIIAEYGHWRRVIDRDNEGGWMHYVMLSGVRTVIVVSDHLLLRAKPSETSPVRAKLEKGVIARIDECTGIWCEFTVDGYTG